MTAHDQVLIDLPGVYVKAVPSSGEAIVASEPPVYLGDNSTCIDVAQIPDLIAALYAAHRVLSQPV